MIIGIGNDIVDVARIEAALNDKFIARIFTSHEQAYCNNKVSRANAYAKRFAAKEALVKALGVKIGSNAFSHEIEVINNSRGAPHVQLYGNALITLQKLIPDGYKANIFLALSDEKSYAIAHVIIEAVLE